MTRHRPTQPSASLRPRAVRRAPLTRVPVHPLLFAAAIVFSAMGEVPASAPGIVRPLLASVVAAGSLTLLASLGLRDVRRGAVAASACIGLLVVAGGIGRRAQSEPALAIAAGLGLLACLLTVALALQGLRTRRRLGLLPTEPLNVVALVLAALTLASAVASGQFDFSSGAMATDCPDTARRQQPDIALFILDGHARADTLARLMDEHDTSFLDGLRARGFDISERARSNYTHTGYTLVSMYEAAPVEDVPGMTSALASGDHRRISASIWRSLQNPRMFRVLRCVGYSISASAVPIEEVALRGADAYRDGGQLNQVEILLLQKSGLAWVLDRVAPNWALHSNRARIEHALAATPERPAGPQLYITHVLSPHLPPAVGPGGTDLPAMPTPLDRNVFADSASAAGIPVDEYVTHYRAQLPWLHAQVLAAVDRILASDRPTVIIVMSDHGSGSRYNEMDPLAAGSDLAERFDTLFAAFTPGHPGLFGDAPTPVNVFPTLLRTYAGLSAPDVTGGQWLGPVRLESGAAGFIPIGLEPHDPENLGDRERKGDP